MDLVGHYNQKNVYFETGRKFNLKQMPEPYFVSVIFLHNEIWSEDDLRRLLRDLVNRGAVYFVFHGNRCEQAHDLADEVCASIIPEDQVSYDNVIGTDWFSDLSPDEVVFAAFGGSIPSDEYLDQFSSFLVISIGTEAENTTIRNLITNIKSTMDMAILRPRNSSSH